MPNPVATFILSDNKLGLEKIAAHCKNTHRYLQLFVVINDSDKTPYQILVNSGKFRGLTFEQLLNHNIIEPHEMNGARCLMEQIVEDDKLICFKALLKKLPLTDAIYNLSRYKIREFLDYRPGAGQQTIKQFCLSGANLSCPKILDALIYDAEYTTSSESSDGDVPGILDPWDIREYEKSEKELKKFIDTHGKSMPEHVRKNADKMDVAFVTYRGVHFVPKHYTSERRQNIRQGRAVIGRPTASYATLTEMGYVADDDLSDNDELKAADLKTRKFFHTLKESPDKHEKKQPSRNEVEFPNLFYRFVQAYVMNYKYLFNPQDPAIQCFFGASSRENPAISTSCIAKKAMSYMSGIRFPDEQRLFPHYRHSTGRPKHPYLGYTDVYVIDPNYFWSYSHYILDLIRRKLINISHVFQFEAEVLFESSIPGKYHYYRDVFRMPDFSLKWTSDIQEEFGFNQDFWEKLKYQLEKANTKDSSNKWLNRIMGHVLQYRALILTKMIKHFLAYEPQKRFVVIPYMEGIVVENSDILTDPKKWRDVNTDSDEDSSFYEGFENMQLSQFGCKIDKKAFYGAEKKYPTFPLASNIWLDGLLNKLPDNIIAAGVYNGAVIVVNEIQYVVYKTAGCTEPTNNNPKGEIYYARPRLRGG